MALFHRFGVPTYFGGLPASYDYINNAISGTPAFADVAKGSGPNAGTYFIAFGEDATSSDANRPAQALAQNCDFIDDTLHRDIALPVGTATQTAGGSISTIVLTGPGVFMGLAGATLAQLFQITDGNDEDIDDGGTQVVVVSAVDSGSVAVGGGFSLGNVTITLNTPITIGQTYRVWYAERTNFATFPADGLTTAHLRNLTEIDAEIEELFRTLHGNGLAWNAAWTSTIYDLAGAGLDARYNRSPLAGLTPVPESYWASTVNTAGSGGWIKRVGPALTVYSAGDASPLSDPLNALFAAKSVDTVAMTSGGVVGFAAYGSRLSATANTHESSTGRTPGAALFLGLWPHDFTTDTDFATNIVAGSSVSLANVGTYNQDTGTAQVTLTAPSYSNNGSNSAIAVGYDLLELQYLLGGVQHNETVVITNISTGAPLVISVRYPNGKVPDWSTVAPTNATVRWISTSFAVGDGAGPYHQAVHSDANPVLLDGLFYQVPPDMGYPIHTDTVPRTPASFSAYSNTAGHAALRWGGFSSAVPSGPVYGGFLNGDGSLSVTATDLNQTAGTFVGSSAGTGGSGVNATAGGSAGFAGVQGSGGTGSGYGGYFLGGSGGAGGRGVRADAQKAQTGGYFNGGPLAGIGVEGYGGADVGASGGTGGSFTGGADAGTGGGTGLVGYGGFSATETLAGAGVVGIGGGSSLPAFASYQGYGGYFVGGVGGNYGVYAQGTDLNAGLYAVGGSDGYGVEAVGTGNQPGVYSTGGSTGGPGGTFHGGSSGAPGVQGFGSGTQPGGYFQAGTGGDDSLYCFSGPAHVDYVIPGITPWTTNPGANRLYGDNIVKAWGTCFIGGGSITVQDGFNIASVAFSGNNIQVTMTRGLSTGFAVVANVFLGTGTGLTGSIPIACPDSPPTGSVFTLESMAGYGTGGSFNYANASLSLTRVSFVVLGHG